MAERWVCHVKDETDRWKLADDRWNDVAKSDWQVDDGEGNYHFLPRSKYRECEPPEVWEDVTAECGAAFSVIVHHGTVVCFLTQGYQPRKVKLFDHGQPGAQPEGTAFLPREQWAFIIERKKS